jgi:hypothetical protein
VKTRKSAAGVRRAGEQCFYILGSALELSHKAEDALGTLSIKPVNVSLAQNRRRASCTIENQMNKRKGKREAWRSGEGSIYFACHYLDR